MSVLTKVGSFAKANLTGTQAITGVGFTPKAIIFWTAGSTAASGTFDIHIGACIGFVTASQSYSSGCSSVDVTSTFSDTGRKMRSGAITIVRWDGAVDEASLTSFDSDGFTLNWSSQGWAVAKQICFLAIGGTDITNATVVNWTTPTATSTKAVTGVGFQPDLVLHLTDFYTTLGVMQAHGYLSFGAMNKHGQQWADSTFAADGANPSNTSRFQQTDACLTGVTTSDVLYAQAHFVSMDTDGFTTNFSTVDTLQANQIASLCLKGLSSKISAFVKPTATAPVAQSITRVGFTPRAVLFTDTIDLPTGPQVWASWEMGAYDGTTQRLAAFVDVDAQTTTNAKAAWFNNAVALGRDGTTTTSQGAATSLDADGFSLNWTPNDGNATETLYLAIGDTGVNTFPSKVA